MIYPKFIKSGDTIGICSLSAGLGHKLEEYEISRNYLMKRGFKIKEAGDVKVLDQRGGSAKERAQALHSLYLDDDVDMVMCAAGGDFLYEILPYVNVEILKSHPKFFMGASDPTSIAFMMTTKLDIASFYGLNGASYQEGYEYIDNNMELIQGNSIEQKSFEHYQSSSDYGSNLFREKVFWKNELNASGRCIGGCLDVIRNLVGTPFQDVQGFIEKYKDDGVIWYFDIFSMPAEDVYLTLLQLKACGWFEHAEAILFGRVLFESNHTGMSYADAYSLALEGWNFAYDLDIGHTLPKMTLINGAIMDVTIKEGVGSIVFRME